MEQARARVRTALGGVRFDALVAGTTVLVLATMLLGVATKATGAGLACTARWPVCDGGFLNLFPQSFPSFFEWLHRVVAGVTGFAILGTVWVAWRDAVAERSRQLVTLGLVLLPLQVYLGRQTVLEFTAPILALHFWTAFTILSSFVAATAVAWRSALTPTRLRNATALGLLLLPLQVLLHPPVVTRFTPPVHTLQYFVTIAVFAAVLSAAIVGRRHLHRTRGYALVGLAMAEPALVYVARHLYGAGSTVVGIYLAMVAAFAIGLVWATLAFHRVR
ncbi:MAG: cytochrome oxidase assembly protein [Halobacteriales archaeon]